ncbi:hypothetical protein COY62_02000, partial [bacterium (Candidatus Howlettbacteria) CG_4_10_14_0_8_um_filter_40_9]
NYTTFYITDPKLRTINKAQVCDRVLHHGIFRVLEPIFEKKFIFDSYSSRKEKGTHKAISRFRYFAWKLSKNNTKTVWVLKCDVRKFFDSVDHEILLRLISKVIKDAKVVNLLEEIIGSFKANLKQGSFNEERGIPLGNLTSQLFSNIYLNALDQFAKRELEEKYYVRYADDFVFLGTELNHLESLVSKLEVFLQNELHLELHPNKIIFRKFSQGIDFLGYVVFPHHTVLRTKTKKRMIRKINEKKNSLNGKHKDDDSFNQSVQSYLGMLTHCRGERIRKEVDKIIQS